MKKFGYKQIIIFIGIIIFISSIFCIFRNFIKKSDSDNKIHIPEYTVREIPDFLTPEECDYIISMSKDKLFPSRVYSSDSDTYNADSRKSDQCWLNDNIQEDTRGLVKSITEKVGKITGTENNYKEPLQVVKYGPGGFFKPHYDPCDGSEDYCKRLNGEHGSRLLTFLIYLNDDYEGGGTTFPNINKTVKPKKGKAVIFYNVDNNKIIYESLHGGDTVYGGNKWIANKWVKTKKKHF